MHEGVERLFDLSGKGAVVTGGASGLGRSIAIVLARAGAVVTLVDRDADGVARATDALRAEGLEAYGAVANVTDLSALELAFERANAHPRGVHIVFANAGISAGPGPLRPEGRLEAIEPARWADVLDVNLTGALNTIRAAARVIRPGYGRIIVTSSLAGVATEPLVGYAYSATKAGVNALVRNAALELASRGTLVNAIAPGIFSTGIGGGNPNQEAVVEAFVEGSALKRAAHPDEIQGLALFLASPAAGFVTGAVFSIDGGAAIARRTIE